jgi:hypothetical protein
MRNTRWLVLALLITVFNVTVVSRCGPILWQAWAGFPLTRLALLLLAGALCSSLTNVWAQTAELVRPRVAHIGESATGPGSQLGGADV